VAHKEIVHKLYGVCDTLASTRDELDTLRIKLADAEDDVAACHVEITALVDNKHKLSSDCKTLCADLEAVTAECTTLIDECDIIKQSLAKLSAQFSVAHTTN
jgi:chromosome segregation ATPase